MQAAVSLAQMKQIAARAAHDINNPLAGIKSSFWLIKGAIPPTHPYYWHVGAIEREIRRLAAVTRRLAESLDCDRDQRTTQGHTPAGPTEATG